MINSELGNDKTNTNQRKSLFPIFKENPDLIYLDNAATTQKPQAVIDGVSDFLKSSYANIHRGLYSLSEKSEELYYESKCALAKLINAQAKEIIYSYNSTYCFNLLAQALVNSCKLGKGDKVLLGIRDHHSNILPRKALSNLFGFEVDFINETENFEIDWNDFNKKFDKHVKVVSISHVSNVTGQIMQIENIRQKIGSDTFLIIDGSQSVPHVPVNIQVLQCDALVMTGHKMMAQTGLGMLYLKHERIKELNPLILGGGTVKDVSTDCFSLQNNTDKRESGTPNIIGAVSLLEALNVIQEIGGMQAIRNHEQTLVKELCKGFKTRQEYIQVLGNLESESRVGVFSFIPKKNSNFNKLGDLFAAENICIRTGGHCAYPLHKSLNVGGSARVSTYLYNTLDDIEKFFKALDEMIN